MKSAFKSCLSQHKETTLIFVLNLDSSEHYINMVITRLTFTRHVFAKEELQWEDVFITVLSKFPHYWVFSPNWCSCRNAELTIDYEKSTFVFFEI
jgi:hypothetical protein